MKFKQQRKVDISVIMPTYNQGAFISRAITSLMKQDFHAWELLIINDGSTDYTKDVIKEYIEDKRIRIFTNDRNLGLGASLNIGINNSRSDLIAYLPSDDIYFHNHLSKLYEAINNDEDYILTFSGMESNYSNDAYSYKVNENYYVNNFNFQLVQVLHKKTNDRWIERNRLVTDSLYDMFWHKILGLGKINNTNCITCEWVSHPAQRHKIINGSLGGNIFKYKRFYNVQEPIKFKSTGRSLIDDNLYKNFRGNQFNKVKQRRLKILLVGELAFNPERIYALEEYGHKLYGLWINNPDFFNTVGPLPFGNIEEIKLDEWEDKILEIQPDIIYGLLNYHAIPLVHHIMRCKSNIPLVWHFKEGPFFALQYGLWKELIELYANSDGLIFINELSRKWYSQFINFENTPYFILDGDLPKKNWFIQTKVKKLSELDGEIHTVVSGRPMGIEISDFEKLAKAKIHIHVYGEMYHEIWAYWLENAKDIASDYIHVHPQCEADKWATELAKYNAGWLHIFESKNDGELIKAKWNDLNIPARLTTLAAAGLPMIQKDNYGHLVATQQILEENKIGIIYSNIDDLIEKLKDNNFMNNVETQLWKKRLEFSFDYYVEGLTRFLNEIIEKYRDDRNPLI